MNKKGMLRNALVFLFSIMFTMSAYAADVYAAEYYTAAQAIEQNTIAPTNEMLNGSAWYAIKPGEGSIMIAFDNNMIGIYNKNEYGDASTLLGDYQLDGNKINVSYLGYVENGQLITVSVPVVKTYYIGLTGDGGCIFSMNGINSISLERMSD